MPPPPLTAPALLPADPQPGRYRHYKGDAYLVLGLARHSETREELVVYQQLYGDRALWVRPRSMFLETVLVAGRRVPRFARDTAADVTPKNDAASDALDHP